MVERKTLSQKGSRVWLTRAQIEAKYQSAEIAQRICEQKLNDPELRKTQTRLHPDDPSEERFGRRLYYI